MFFLKQKELLSADRLPALDERRAGGVFLHDRRLGQSRLFAGQGIFPILGGQLGYGLIPLLLGLLPIDDFKVDASPQIAAAHLAKAVRRGRSPPAGQERRR
jgi:hypothetical protein